MSPLVSAGWSISIAPVQKMRYGMTIDPFGIESNGLKLKRLRRLGNGLFGGDAQCVVHLDPLSVFLIGIDFYRVYGYEYTQFSCRNDTGNYSSRRLNNIN